MADRHKIAPLTEQQIAEARANAVEAQREAACLTGEFLVFLCDSHETLRADVRRLVKALRTLHHAADFYVRWGCGVGDEDSGGSSFDRLARAAGEAKTVLAGYEVDDG